MKKITFLALIAACFTFTSNAQNEQEKTMIYKIQSGNWRNISEVIASPRGGITKDSSKTYNNYVTPKDSTYVSSSITTTKGPNNYITITRSSTSPAMFASDSVYSVLPNGVNYTVHKEYDNVTKIWKITQEDLYYYDKSNYMDSMIVRTISPQINKLEILIKTVFVHDSKGILLADVSYLRDFSIGIFKGVPANKYEYTYLANGDKDTQTSFWWNTLKSVFEKASTSKCSYPDSYTTSQEYTALDGTKISLLEYKYKDIKKTLPISYISKRWDNATNKYILDSEQDTKYNASSQIIEDSYKSYYNNSVQGSQRTHAYKNGVLALLTYSDWDKTASLFKLSSKTYYFKPAISGTKEDILASKVLIYPNPTTNEFMVEAPENSLINVMDVSGKILLKNMSSTESTNLQSFPAGVYFVQVVNNGVSTIQKIVKQ